MFGYSQNTQSLRKHFALFGDGISSQLNARKLGPRDTQRCTLTPGVCVKSPGTLANVTKFPNVSRLVRSAEVLVGQQNMLGPRTTFPSVERGEIGTREGNRRNMQYGRECSDMGLRVTQSPETCITKCSICIQNAGSSSLTYRWY